MSLTRKRPTIKDVARLSGVSTTTVSYVINDGPRGVDPETKSRILAIIEELQYHPSTVARGLSQKRLDCIGVVFPKPDQRLVVDSYFSAILDGVVAAATNRKQNVMLYTGLEWTGRSSMPAFLDRRVDGLVLVAVDTDSDIVAALADAGLPFVLISDTVSDTRVNSIGVDNIQAVHQVIAHLAALGHKRIAYMGGERVSPSSLPRQAGYVSGMRKYGLPIDEDLMVEGFYSRGWGREYAMEMLARPDAPTAIFAGGDGIAMGIYDAAIEMKIAIPESLSIVGFDDAMFAMYLSPPLTTVRQPLHEIGEQAAVMLLEQIDPSREELSAPERVTQHTELIVRSSTAPPGT